MVRAVYAKEILWPQKQEDRDEGGWQSYSNPSSVESKSRDPPRRRKASSPEQARTVVVDAERTEEMDWTDHPRDEPVRESEVRVGAEGMIDQRIRGRPPLQTEDIV